MISPPRRCGQRQRQRGFAATGRAGHDQRGQCLPAMARGVAVHPAPLSLAAAMSYVLTLVAAREATTLTDADGGRRA